MTAPWQRREVIGNAVLYLGDAREIASELTGITISDPPYGNATAMNHGGMWHRTGIVHDDTLAVRDEVMAALNQPFAIFAAINKPRPDNARATLVWEKGEHVGAGDLALPWKPNVELIHVGGHGWAHRRRQTSVLRYNAISGCVGNRNDGHRWHPFEKPVDLMAHLIERAPAGVIVDPFMGSGTTGIAAIQQGRSFVGVEIDPTHFDTACRRIEDAQRQGSLFGAAA